MSYLPDIHRLLPSSEDAEKGVLASFMLAPIEVAQICAIEGVSPERFHFPAYAKVFTALLEMVANCQPVDFVTLTNSLRSAGSLDAVGGAAFITTLYTFISTAANVRFYIAAMNRDYLSRQVIKICTEYAARAYDTAEDPEKLAGDAHGALTGLLVKKSKRQTVKQTLQEIVDEVARGKDDSGIVRTGIEVIDDRLKLFRGNLLIISAPTSCGKSALSLQMASHMALAGSRVAIYTLEMSQKETLTRMIAQIGGNNADFVRRAVALSGLTPSDFTLRTVAEFRAAVDRILQIKMHIRDDLTRAEDIFADFRAEHAKEPFDFCLIDYLQIIRSTGKYERKQLQIADITQRAKALANECGTVICIPSQVNKDGGTREAEDAENDASALLKITGEKDDKGNVRPERVSIWKQRAGARHIDIPLVFNGLLTRFDAITQ